MGTKPQRRTPSPEAGLNDDYGPALWVRLDAAFYHALFWTRSPCYPQPVASLPPPVVAAVGRFRAALTATFRDRVREIVLYGSYARGEATEDSDVDVLVVIEGLSDEERATVFDLAYRADAADPDGWVGLSALPYSVAQAAELRARERLLFRDIAREGIAV